MIPPARKVPPIAISRGTESATLPAQKNKVWTYSDDLACRRKKRLRAIARMLVHCHRLRIEAVARTLLDRGSLSAEELDALMQCGNPDAILPSFDEHGCARS
jgi:hypothetical protein